MRLFAAFVFLLIQTQLALAAITPEQLRQMAYRGDIHGAEAAFRAAHQETRNGTLQYDDLRRLVSTLIVTHPDVLAFVVDWRAEYPDSPYANSLWVFQNDKIASAIRTKAPARLVHPRAMQTFGSLQREGMDVALQAYAAAPDYVPASDAVLTLNQTTRMLRWSKHLQILTDVMEVTPNRGSLFRASLITRPEWGGEGHTDIVRLCNMFAAKVPDVPDYNPVICTIDLIHASSVTPDHGRAFSYKLIDDALSGDVDHPRLARARANRALDLNLQDERSAVISYLSQPGLFDDQMYVAFLSQHVPRYDLPDGHTDPQVSRFIALYKDKLAKFVEEGLLHDPYAPDVLLRGYEIYDDRTQEGGADHTRIQELLRKRSVAASPYAGSAWRNLAVFLQRGYPPGSDPALSVTALDPVYINAIYYSRHHFSSIGAFLNKKSNLYSALRDLEERDLPNPLLKGQELAWVACPIVRLSRLLEDSCKGRSECETVFTYDMNRAAGIVADLAKAGLCGAERNAPLQSLYYTEPRPYDLGALNEGIANR